MAAATRQSTFDSGLKRWNADDNGVYVLNRGDLSTERTRLDYNHHHIWLPLCGGQLCPAPVLAHLRQLPTTAAAAPSPRVAEIATGTGTWLREIAAQLPASAELRGFDMDTTKFPPASELPKNVTMTQHNALQPFPEELHGTFDLVHVRLIVLGMKKGDWEVVARNLFALLKPGGYVHWEEISNMGWEMVPHSKAFAEWIRVSSLWSMKVGRDPFMPARLPLVLEDTGFQDVECKIFNTVATRDMLREPMKKIAVEVVRPIMLAVLEDGGMETVQTVKDVDRIEAEVQRDVVEKDALVGFYYNWVWGRRP